jgi:ionotropic glutamate receptor
LTGKVNSSQNCTLSTIFSIAQNNKEAHPYPCRVFTLKESFWFALTSFTPQGGGEAPKSLSGRVLVAAYWLFVVLMLATFTANLAAFLTVERMQTTVQSEFDTRIRPL